MAILDGSLNLQNPNPLVHTQYALYHGGWNNGRIDLTMDVTLMPGDTEKELVNYLKQQAKTAYFNNSISKHIVRVTTTTEIIETFV